MIAVLIPQLGIRTAVDEARVKEARIAAKAVDWPGINAETVRIEHTIRPAVAESDDTLADHIRMMRTTTGQWTMLAVWPWWTEDVPHRRIVGLGADVVARSKRPSVWPRPNGATVLILNRAAYDALYDSLEPSGQWWTSWHTNPDPWNQYAV